MSAVVENNSDRSSDPETIEVSKADVFAKKASVEVGEETRTESPGEAGGDRPAGSKCENDTVYVNGHPVIENGMVNALL